MAFEAAAGLFDKYQVPEKNPYITHPFQDRGYQVAAELDDLGHKSFYMKLAKNELPLLEKAFSFVKDAPKSVRSRAKLFMWKLKELRKEQKG